MIKIDAEIDVNFHEYLGESSTRFVLLFVLFCFVFVFSLLT